jgi:hypothetical protein
MRVIAPLMPRVRTAYQTSRLIACLADRLLAAVAGPAHFGCAAVYVGGGCSPLVLCDSRLRRTPCSVCTPVHERVTRWRACTMHTHQPKQRACTMHTHQLAAAAAFLITLCRRSSCAGSKQHTPSHSRQQRCWCCHTGSAGIAAATAATTWAAESGHRRRTPLHCARARARARANAPQRLPAYPTSAPPLVFHSQPGNTTSGL